MDQPRHRVQGLLQDVPGDQQIGRVINMDRFGEIQRRDDGPNREQHGSGWVTVSDGPHNSTRSGSQSSLSIAGASAKADDRPLVALAQWVRSIVPICSTFSVLSLYPWYGSPPNPYTRFPSRTHGQVATPYNITPTRE